MATSLTLENDSSLAQGYLKVNGSTAATLTTSGITGNLTGNVTGSLTQGGSLTLAAAQTASGTAVDFTGIPSWAKRITVMFSGVSTNGTSNAMLQIGTSGGIETTGYVGSCASTSFAPSGFGITYGTASVSVAHGIATIAKINGNSWVYSVSVGYSSSAASASGGGSKTLSGTLDRIRLTTVNGTDTFDAGTINISYEG